MERSDIAVLKRINAIKARQNLGEIMDEVNLRNDEYIIERNGKPIAAIVPVWLLLNQQRQAGEVMQILDKYRDTDDFSDEEAMKLANEAVQSIRIKKRTMAHDA